MATPTVQWQCLKTLPECLLRMLEEEIACDVTFLIGKEAHEMKAHRVILMSRSPVFFSMLEGPQAEKRKIAISDIDRDSFTEFLRYLYTDKFESNPKTVMAVLHCAKKYCVDNLSKACAEFLQKNISTENVFKILNAAHRFDDEGIKDTCIAILLEDTKSCLENREFLSLSKESLDMILSLDGLNCDAEKMYERVMKWAGEECRRQELENTSANQRAVLEDLVYKIPFPTMDPPYFSKHVVKTSLLTEEEKVSILAFFNLKDESLISKFVQTERITKYYNVDRFQEVSDTWELTGFTDEISFELSHDAKLHGIRVYGSSRDQSTITYKFSIKHQSGNILYSDTKSITTNPSKVTYDILLPKHINLKKGELYGIDMVQTCKEKTLLYFGTNGQRVVRYCHGKTVTFSFVDLPGFKTVNSGQISGLILL